VKTKTKIKSEDYCFVHKVPQNQDVGLKVYTPRWLGGIMVRMLDY